MIFRIGASLSCPGGDAQWSETKEPRKPIRGANRFDLVPYHNTPFGPYPKELLNNIKKHWLLLRHQTDELPMSFNYLHASHVAGVPVMCEPLAKEFCVNAGHGHELVGIPNIWSLTLDRLVHEPYYFPNIYRNIETIDLAASGAEKMPNPQLAQKFFLASDLSNLRVLRGFTGAEGVWRDRLTSHWLCDDTFRQKIEKLAPGYFDFSEVQVAT